MSCCPEHSSTYCDVFTNTLYNERRRNTIIEHVIQHKFLIAKYILNCIPSQVNMGEADVEDCTGNKKLLSLMSRRLEGTCRSASRTL